MVCLLFAGIGGAIYVEYPPAASGPGGGSFALSRADPDDETFAQLSDYARSVDAKAVPAGAENRLPDVSTMIDRLAARLEITPGDIRGWQMLGWSYVQTGRYDKAATAYAKAAALDPSSAELKLALGEAKVKAKAAASDTAETPASLQTRDGESGETRPEAAAAVQAMAIRSMVDGLAARLERSPRNVEGWTRLMRSRVVLGEREVAATALRKALDVFKDDGDASSKITAAAIELGLKAE